MIKYLLGFAVGCAVVGAAVAFAKRLRPRRVRPRVREFAKPQSGTSISIALSLAVSSHHLLAQALQERSNRWRSANNHSSDCAVGVIPLALAALDAWLNDIIATGRFSLSQDQIERLSDFPTDKKIAKIAKQFGKPIAVPPDLKLLTELRHEIIHPLPYTQDISSRSTVPRWLTELEKKQLFITTGTQAADFHFSQKLGSYALAYWACETVFKVAEVVASAMQQNPWIGHPASYTVDNFRFYQGLTSPARLPRYDQEAGLSPM